MFVQDHPIVLTFAMEPKTISVPRIVQLAGIITNSVAKIQEILVCHNAPSPSFDEDAPPLPQAIENTQNAILDATAELHDLLTEPVDMIHRVSRACTMNFPYHLLSAANILYDT